MEERIEIDLEAQDTAESTALLPPSSPTIATGAVVTADVGTAANDALLGVPSVHGQAVPHSLQPARHDALRAAAPRRVLSGEMSGEVGPSQWGGPRARNRRPD